MSGSNYFLDTNIVVPFLNGDELIAQKISELEVINLPIIVLGELYYGAMKSARPDKNTRTIQTLIEQCNVYPTDEEVALYYGEIKAILSKQGTPIPENDIWIAAISKTYNFPVVTRDKHFENIPDIQIVKW